MTTLFRSLFICLSFCLAVQAAEPLWQPQTYTPAPADNPLKGLVPYAGAANPDDFPHSMEFSYFPLAAVLKAPGMYDWSELDRFLDAVAARGHQAIFRFHVEYPGKRDALPAYLRQQGVVLTIWQRKSTPPRPPVEVETPDYANPLLRQALLDFIAALGQRYDGDARIGFITAGLLGLWGEWHAHPRMDLFADKALQADVMAAYGHAFRQTPILLRYPAAEGDPVYAANADAPFGYHDDSFAWNTLPSRDHFFLAKMQAAGALATWQSRPIGGEIRPEAWGKVFDAAPDNPAIEDFAVCVQASHVSWLMDSGMFRGGNSAERRARALAEVSRMGYEFFVSQVALVRNENQLTVRIQIENRGVAPFYYPWPLEYALLDAQGRVARQARTTGALAGILPQAAPALREQALDLVGLAEGSYRVLLRVANPLPAAHGVRFANTRQSVDLPGWLTLGDLVW